ncbi:energy transducer TonB [Sphingomonas sp.]|uniref:energy transducer TonB n=1 Tax=Sphingomonas sp. TaxID=28214 RepID=UPI0025D233DA|nr:energy transducer TonB [Sphingomonas sp.]MBV9529121.1 energy transducer TonB [Sphingomonas sp.]
MTSYTGSNRPRDRAKAIAAVIAIHIALAAVIVAGLNVTKVRQVVDQLQTIDIHEVLPPPPLHRPPPQPRKAKLAAGAPAPRAQPTEVVAPTPRVPEPSVIPAAHIAGAGSSPASGAATAGSGTGAGGNGNGPGGGGNGAGFTPARLVRNIPSSQYERLASTGLANGLVGVTLLVGPDGTPGNCRIARSSGDSGLDGLVCQLTLRYVRFNPARDPQGRPVSQDITYFPNWRQR